MAARCQQAEGQGPSLLDQDLRTGAGGSRALRLDRPTRPAGRCHNSGVLPDAAGPADDPLEQDAPDHVADDPATGLWFLGEGDRANLATDLRAFTTGNLVRPLVDGRSYFARLCAELQATEPGDQVYFLDFRGDLDERLDGPGSEVGEVLGLAAQRGVQVFGL